jgi:hypothetical protein
MSIFTPQIVVCCSQATEKERQDAEGAAIAERRLKERNRVKSEGLQKRWLLWLAFLQRTHCLVSRVRGHQDEIAQQQKELAAAQVLFRVLRRVAERARRKRLRSAITAVRRAPLLWLSELPCD